MAKMFRVMVTLVLAGIMLLTIAGPVFAGTALPLACWNNCGIGGETKTN